MYRTSRRQLLKNLATVGSASLLMPTLSRLAFAEVSQLKVVFAVIPDGFAVDPYGGYDNGLWFPSAASTDTTNFTLNEMSRHLGEYANQSLFLKGLILGSGTGGHNGWQTLLRNSNGNKTSIDLILADQLPGSNPAFRRLYSGPHAMVGASWNISWRDSTMLLPEDDPYQLFNALYDGFQPGSGITTTQDSSHIFDPVKADIAQLQSVLGNSERQKLASHLDAIEQFIQDARNTLPVTGECNAANGEPITGLNIHAADDREAVTRAHANLLASGLSCGFSRVATFQIGRSADQVVLKNVSATRNPHDCAHRYGSVEEWRDSRAWYVQQVKYLLDRLNTYPDPDSPGDSLLKHTLVVLTSEMADGAPEHMQDLPITLIGGASGLLRNGNGSGRFLDLSSQGDRSHWKLGQVTDVQRVWSTLARAAGTQVNWDGDTSTLNGVFTHV